MTKPNGSPYTCISINIRKTQFRLFDIPVDTTVCNLISIRIKCVCTSIITHPLQTINCFKMDNINIYIEEQLTRFTFKLFQPDVLYFQNSNLTKMTNSAVYFQVFKCEHLQYLAEKYKFVVWETCNRNEFSSGQFVFRSFMDCYTFCREEQQLSYLKWDNFWYQKYCGKIAFSLFENMQNGLNEDCIEEIAQYLDVVSFCDLFGVIKNESLTRIAHRKFSNLVINSPTVGEKFGMLNFYYILLSIGQNVINITVSMRSFRSGSRDKWNFKLKYAIVHCICYLASNIRFVTLENFNSESNDPKFQPLFSILTARNVSIKIN